MTLDPSIQKLVEALNTIPGVTTHSSCAGHHNPAKGQTEWGKFVVDFSVPYNECGWKALEHIVSCMDKWHESGGALDSLRWSLDGEYSVQGDIDEFAEIVEAGAALVGSPEMLAKKDRK